MSSGLTINYKSNSKNVLNIIENANYAGLTASAITMEGAIVNKINNMNIVDTGRYKNSITYKTIKSKSKASNSQDDLNSVAKPLEALIGTNLSYAPYLEYGHKQGKRFVAPRPAIRRAWDETKGKLDRIFTLQFKKVFG
jgi:hypothetical protein